MKNENNYSYINKSYILILSTLLVITVSLVVGLSKISNRVTENKFNQINETLNKNTEGKEEIVTRVNQYYNVKASLSENSDVSDENIEKAKDDYTRVLHDKDIRLNSASFVLLTKDNEIISGLDKNYSNYFLETTDVTPQKLLDAISNNVKFGDVQAMSEYGKTNYIYNIIYLGELNNGDKLFLLTNYKK